MASMQGTYEFMSDDLRMALWTMDPYLHSPVDDLFSFGYTVQWAAAFNDGASGRKHDGTKIQRFREMIADDRRGDAVMLLGRLAPSLAEHGPFFVQSLVLLVPWWTKLSALARDWSFAMEHTDALKGKDKEERLRLNFLTFGYRGVGEYFELVHEHRASLQAAV